MNDIVQHSSKTNEAYTPDSIVGPARRTMRGFDLDPASCALAQTVVRARRWYGQGSPFGEDGLLAQWNGTVFLNPPGGIESNSMFRGSRAAWWWEHLYRRYAAGETTEAIFVCFTMAVFRTAQHQGLKSRGVPPPFAFPFCVPSRRINYDKVVWQPNGNDTGSAADGVWTRVPTKGAPSDTAIVYLPDRCGPEAGFARFEKAFSPLGYVRE